MILDLYSALFDLFVALPAAFLALAWRRNHREKVTFILLTLSLALLASGMIHRVKVTLWGPDYSARLFATLEVNMVLAAVAGLYLCFTRRWIGALAAFLLALDWLYVAVINSVV